MPIKGRLVWPNSNVEDTQHCSRCWPPRRGTLDAAQLRKYYQGRFIRYGKLSCHLVKLSQWVSEVTAFSSQYNSDSWSASQVVGENNVFPKYGDHRGAWAQKRGQFDRGWIKVAFEKPVVVDYILIFETYHGGAVVRVSLKDPQGVWKSVYRGQAKDITTAHVSRPILTKTDFATREVRLDLDLSKARTYCEIDAIKMVGTDENAAPQITQWVKTVTGYSSQYNSDTWSADQVKGLRNVYPKYGDLRNTWAQRRGQFTSGWIEVAYETPVNVKAIAIFETYHAGAVTKVSLKNPSGQWKEVYSGAASDIKRARAFKPTLKATDFFTNEVRLDMDLSKAGTYCEIDAISITGPEAPEVVEVSEDDCQWKEYKDQYAGGGELQRGYMELDDCKRKCLDVSCKGIDFGKRQCWLHITKDREPMRSRNISHYKPLNCY